MQSEQQQDIKEMKLFKLSGILVGHNSDVSSLATAQGSADTLLSGARDKTAIKQKIQKNEEGELTGYIEKRLYGHSHFIQDVALSNDGLFALTGSQDNELRLQDLKTGETTRRFVGHKNVVLSVAFSPDNRQIMSASMDRKVKLWNTIAQCKFTSGEDAEHTDWVTCVRFSPNPNNPLFVSACRDATINVWDLNSCKVRAKLTGHTGYVNSVTVSPDGSLCASGGKDGLANLWDLKDGRHLASLLAGETINDLCFSPSRYQLCAATGSQIKIWNLETKDIISQLEPVFKEVRGKKYKPIECTSLAWSSDGDTLYAGYTDNYIRIWTVVH